MRERLDTVLDNFKSIQKDLLDFTRPSDEIIELQKKLAEVETLASMYQEYLKIEKAIKDTQKIIDNEKDQELILIAKDEVKDLLNKLQKKLEEMKIEMIPKDPNDKKNVIVEIKGAVGGDEANIFAGDLFRMYQRYAEQKGYKIDIIDSNPSGGGYSNIEFMIKGKGAYSFFKYESGVHRVQRVPETESQGRVHTSTATVYVSPEAEDIDIELNEKDLKIEAHHSTGAGGQSVNTTLSAIRITHIPTGIVATCQNERSQIQNKAKALVALRSKLYQKKLDEEKAKSDKQRKGAIGHGMRSEKIRTYNYPQNRVSDHRFNITIKRLTDIIDGNLDLVITPLIHAFEEESLKENEK